MVNEKNKELVSIIVPCYNHEKYIESCLNSILSNSYQNKEIVIIDDGSTDNSKAIINNWINKNDTTIKVSFSSRSNKGLNKTLNELISLSSGKFICLLASDDMLTNDSIQVRLNILLNNPKKMAVIGDAFVVNSEGDIIMKSAIENYWKGHKEYYMSDEKLKYMVIYNFSVPGPVLMVNRDIYDVIGMYPEDITIEDVDFYLKAIARDLVIFIDHNVAFYRVLETSLCHNKCYFRTKAISMIKSYYRNMYLYRLRDKITLLKLILYRTSFVFVVCKYALWLYICIRNIYNCLLTLVFKKN